MKINVVNSEIVRKYDNVCEGISSRGILWMAYSEAWGLIYEVPVSNYLKFGNDYYSPRLVEHI